MYYQQVAAHPVSYAALPPPAQTRPKFRGCGVCCTVASSIILSLLAIAAFAAIVVLLIIRPMKDCLIFRHGSCDSSVQKCVTAKDAILHEGETVLEIGESDQFSASLLSFTADSGSKLAVACDDPQRCTKSLTVNFADSVKVPFNRTVVYRSSSTPGQLYLEVVDNGSYYNFTLAMALLATATVVCIVASVSCCCWSKHLRQRRNARMWEYSQSQTTLFPQQHLQVQPPPPHYQHAPHSYGTTGSPYQPASAHAAYVPSQRTEHMPFYEQHSVYGSGHATPYAPSAPPM
eukprot:ANDGO_03337.mRNA.1 hypothetical protein